MINTFAAAGTGLGLWHFCVHQHPLRQTSVSPSDMPCACGGPSYYSSLTHFSGKYLFALYISILRTDITHAPATPFCLPPPPFSSLLKLCMQTLFFMPVCSFMPSSMRRQTPGWSKAWLGMTWHEKKEGRKKTLRLVGRGKRLSSLLPPKEKEEKEKEKGMPPGVPHSLLSLANSSQTTVISHLRKINLFPLLLRQTRADKKRRNNGKDMVGRQERKQTGQARSACLSLTENSSAAGVTRQASLATGWAVPGVTFAH